MIYFLLSSLFILFIVMRFFKKKKITKLSTPIDDIIPDEEEKINQKISGAVDNYKSLSDRYERIFDGIGTEKALNMDELFRRYEFEKAKGENAEFFVEQNFQSFYNEED